MTSHIQYYNPLYSAISEYEDFLPIISATSVGFTIGGPVGAGVAFTLGTVDYLAVNNFKIYSSSYLTYAVLGAGTVSKLKLPYYVAQILGATFGLLFPTGMLNNYIDKGVAPISGAIYGYSYAGPYGAAGGFVAGVADESLHAFNISSQYYASTIIKNVAISNLLLPILPHAMGLLPNIFYRNQLSALTKIFLETNYAKESIGTALGGIESYNTPKPEKWSAITLATQLREIYSDILDEEALQKTIEHRLIIEISSSIILQSLSLTREHHYSRTKSAINDFKTTTTNAWQDFFDPFKKFTRFVPYYVLITMFSKTLNTFFNTNTLYKIDNLITAELTKNETILQMLQENNDNSTDPNTLLKRKYHDIEHISSKASTLLSEAVSSTVQGISSIDYLISTNAQNMIVISIFYNEISSILSNWLSTQSRSYDIKITELSDKRTSLEEYFRVNADSLIQRNSNEFVEYQLNQCAKELRTLLGERAFWHLFHSTWSTARHFINFFISYLWTAHYLNINTINYKDHDKILLSNNFLQIMLAWSEKNAGEIISVEQSIYRLNELLLRMRSIQEKDMPEHKYQIKQEGDPWLCFDNLEVSAGTTHLITTEHACIEKDIISVTGESHSGKSTLLKLVKGIEYSSASGNGTISFYTENGLKPTILMASQHYNFPPYIKLLETITLKPYEEAKSQKEFVQSLMKEMRIDSENQDPNAPSLMQLLDEEKDWNQYITSGGARKKIMAIWMILSNPDIAILDEIFVGIDREAIQNIQVMFKKYLPDTKFLIVDHEASTHNFDDFYQDNLHIENKTIHMQSLRSQEPVSSLEYCEIQSIFMGDICEA